MGVSFNVWLLILGPMVFGLAIKWPRKDNDIIYSSKVGIIRRFSAFIIDLYIAGIGILPIICLPSLLLEYMATGEWQWSFQRGFFRKTDIIGNIFFFVGIYGIYKYFNWHFKNHMQTIGQYLLRFTLIPTQNDLGYKGNARKIKIRQKED